MIRLAAPMHDIGKVAIPESILMKPAKLTLEEYDVMKGHAEIGYNIFKNSKLEMLKAAATIAYQHHEKWNGEGYPRGLKGKEIHVYGRLIALADVIDALANKRCYKDAWPMSKVIETLKMERGQHFEPILVDVFLESLEEYEEIKNMYP